MGLLIFVYALFVRYLIFCWAFLVLTIDLVLPRINLKFLLNLRESWHYSIGVKCALLIQNVQQVLLTELLSFITG